MSEASFHFDSLDSLPDSVVEAWGQGRLIDASEVLARAEERGVELPADIRASLESELT
jgi:hypothetical protein